MSHVEVTLEVGTIEVQMHDKVVVVETPNSQTSIIEVGIQGAPGGGAFVHTQATPATTWTINHNLGYRPSVELFDDTGQEFNAQVVHVNTNQCVVYIVIAIAGSARCT